MTSCPCGSGRTYDDCCGPLIAGQAPAATAEALMRSRYTAFTTGAVDYIMDTVHPDHRADMDRAHIEDWSKSSEWTGLEVLSREAGGADDAEGWVEFVARFRLQGKGYSHHETGYFQKDENGRWTYVDGNSGPRTVRRAAPKVGRNDPCPCGSGKKYKKCCGAAA